MEKYSQFRDRGSGVAPFFPIPTASSGLYLPFHVSLFFFRLPLLIFFTLAYFAVLQWLPIGSLGKKASLWSILGIPGIWWIDLQIDGVRRGSLARAASSRLPQPGSIIASSSTSPIDALYLAAIFDPVFTASYPSTRLVEPISLFQAMYRAFLPPVIHPSPEAQLVDLQTMLKENPLRAVVVFPEGTTTNGRGILPFSPSLLTTPPRTKIFPVSLRYTPADITTPVPGSYVTFMWNLMSKPTHCIRVRIAEAVYNTSQAQRSSSPPKPISSYTTNFLDTLQQNESPGTSTDKDETASSTSTLLGDEADGAMHAEEKAVLDKVGLALARLGRVERVGLGVREKMEFVKAWGKGKGKKRRRTY